MAVDTAAKRSSVLRHGFPGGPLPVPSGTVGEGPRAQTVWQYLGMDYDNPSPPVAVVQDLVRRVMYTMLGRR